MQRHRIQDATGVIIDNEPIGKQKIVTTTPPTNSQAGFAPGCEWTNIQGAAGSIYFINQGTNLSSVWLALA